MPLKTIGPYGAAKALAAATLSFAPVADRAAIIHRILLTGVSASDTWVVQCDGQELARFLERTTGNQQLLGSKTVNYPKNFDIFRYLQALDQTEISYPVPQGTTWTITSVGGATANILIEYTEHLPAEINPSMPNHPHGNRKILPVYAYVAAAVTVAGDKVFDTEVKPNFIPTLFTDSKFPPGWRASVNALFLQGEGVNTFSGAANHQSVTDHLYVENGGQRLFNRTAADGIPCVGSASAAGSANIVRESDLNLIPPFQELSPWQVQQNDPDLLYIPGSTFIYRLNITGDVTGGADYSDAVLAAIVDISQVGQ